MSAEETIQEVLEGNLPSSKCSLPRLVKIYIASTREDFAEERRQLLEMVGPELQGIYDNKDIEVEFVDMHYCTEDDPAYDAFLFDDHLQEIADCHRVSRGCFFVCLVGNTYQPCPLPARLDEAQYQALLSAARHLGLRADLLDAWYNKDDDNENETDNGYFLDQPNEVGTPEWRQQHAELLEVVQGAARHLSTSTVPNKFRNFTQSAVERQFTEALGLGAGTAHRMLIVVRDWENLPADQQLTEDREQLKNFRDRLAASVPNENRAYLTVPWKPGGMDLDTEEHEAYLNKFRDVTTEKLQHLISRHLDEEPEVKARNAILQEVYQEALTHLLLCHDKDKNCEDWSNSETLDHVKKLFMSAYEGEGRHPPVIVQGGHGAGKTSLIRAVYASVESWFPEKPLRIVRHCGATPRASYNLEMLRVTCQQLRILLHQGHTLPRDASFDPLYVNNWFQQLLRRFEQEQEILVLLLDDLHRLNPLDSDIVAALSWVPISLPSNVHILCTTTLPPEQLKLTPVQRERFRNPECYMEIAPNPGVRERIEEAMGYLEEKFGKIAVTRLASYLSCTEFGLSETELLELLMPTTNSNIALSLSDGFFNFSTLCAVRHQMEPLLLEKLMSGKLLLCWRHELTADVAKKRYLQSQESRRSIHGHIANLFFSEFSQEEEEEERVQVTEKIKTEEAHEEKEEEEEDDKEGTPTPLNALDDVTYSLRHVEECWIHLLKAGDSNRLKQLTVCNFDFLLAAVQTISVSYLRCVLEHVRCYLLDRDLELVYYTVRKSSDVLTRDPLQLGAQVVCWLRSVQADSSEDRVSHMITSAMAWCDGFNAPLLVPLNGWLQPPLPLQIKSLHCPSGVRLIEPTPSAQHVVVVPQTGDPQLWHVMSNTLTHTFKGHSRPVLCAAITKRSHYLITGSEDTSVIIWDLQTLQLMLRIYEHIAPVLSITPALNNSIVVSGGEDSSIIICSLLVGKVIMKIDHHRGPVTAVRVNSAGDVLVSGSSDATICLWSLENFTLLNTISLAHPVLTLDVSCDSVFLLAACEDNQLYLHSLATGTEIHSLRGHKAQICSLCLANDSCRAVVGGSDGKIYIFDMHSGRLNRTLTSHSTEVTGVKVTDKDDFLITAGGNRLTFWSFRREDAAAAGAGPVHGTTPRKASQQQNHTAPITCLDVSRDGLMAVTGCVDSLVNVWQLNTHELHSTLEGHFASVTCVAFSPNGLFAVSGSEDKTIRVWGLTLALLVSTFKGHQAPITAVAVMLDSRRVVSGDRSGMLAVWVADNATLLHSCSGPSKCLAITNNMKYVVCCNGDNSLRIWSLNRDEERYTVSHSEEVTCFVLTMDSLHVITGSRDMSLKVWQVAGGKLAQVLVGHSDHVTCVAVPILNKSLVVSGSRDSNLIIWDINTGNDIHVLTGHLGYVTCVKLTGDGSLAVSGSEDKSIIVWDTKRGRALSLLQLHVPILGLEMSTDATRLAVHLLENRHLPIICLHNTPATYVKMPTYVAPAKDVEDLRPSAPKRPMRRLLKKEVSLDTYTWQKKYGHLTSSIMMAAVDERLKRRFSVSASMEEISKIPSKGNMGSQQGIGPEQAALAQSQHFDQLEALWNKRSPPRRRHNQSLSKQNSRASRRDSSETGDDRTPCEEFVELPDERMCM